MRALALAVLAFTLAAVGCGGGSSEDSASPADVPASMKVTSPAFSEGGTIPKKFTCDGPLGGVNPPLDWSRRPPDTKSQALVVSDPDAPGGNFTHWTVWGMMARTNGLQADIPPVGLPQGRNSAGTSKYAPPCPPKGDSPHRYRFTIYALREPLALKTGAPSDEVLNKIEEAAIARGVLTGTYAR